MPLCCFIRKKMNNTISKAEVKDYLRKHPHIAEEYLLQSTSSEMLEKLIAKKRQLVSENVYGNLRLIRKKSLFKSISQVYTDTGMEAMTRKICSCSTDEEIYEQIYSICNIITSALDADGFVMFVMDSSEKDIAKYTPETGPIHSTSVGHNDTLASYVAVENQPLCVSNVHKDRRFPNGVGDDRFNECHALCSPIMLETGNVFCLISFVRVDLSRPFDEYDFEMITGIFSWIMACVRKIKKNRLLQVQEALNGFLLQTTRVMFDDMEDIDTLVTNIMTFTKNLVCADRSALFLVDEERDELYADYFDEGKMSTTGVPEYTKTSQIRFSKELGIAGFVARTGESVNIKDAYSDERFNQEVDKKTGYRTRNILCMPISGKHGVLGVVQMINRKNGTHFTVDDESAFKLFAVYCALAIHYSRIYNMLAHKQIKYKVAMDVLQYHISCPDDEFNALYEKPILPRKQVPTNFDSYDFCCYDYNNILPQLFIRMILETFGENEFEMAKLCRFVLTVRKNYRNIQYHNWHHGFHVAHALWQIIARSSLKLTKLEKMAMIIGGLCHDIDHRGFNNEFFKKLKHPLAALYTTSVMEQHHYKQTVTILHADGHEIFSHLTAFEHKNLLENIRTHILATDLALYFPTQKYLTSVMDEGGFNPEMEPHRNALLSLIMTAADLCAITKPWETQQRTAKYIYEEFYMQGDEEKKRGLQPLPMMDRINQRDIPKMQVGFIGFICKPMYTTLSKLLPETEHLLKGCICCHDSWKQAMEEQAANAEKQAGGT